ncbi:uncharacterized protein B0J16DRAFT_160139 [Fusarium flagelliforme]|uniref:uncharacterized protein n=1 Tax=Fusarium flagelliforme TaxID=2675880 RepID=UPI001E8D85FB|nr:uncharacterized protein B0J16DRAFT_160139 [Fusarium flagelliforme]KAH7183029.1 hypothetical protein B0J16DRAFT_160139 [Fusarium flagelliforme]
MQSAGLLINFLLFSHLGCLFFPFWEGREGIAGLRCGIGFFPEGKGQEEMRCDAAMRSNAGGREGLASLTAPLRRRYLHFYLLDTCLMVLCCSSPFVCSWLII